MFVFLYSFSKSDVTTTTSRHVKAPVKREILLYCHFTLSNPRAFLLLQLQLHLTPCTENRFCYWQHGHIVGGGMVVTKVVLISTLSVFKPKHLKSEHLHWISDQILSFVCLYNVEYDLWKTPFTLGCHFGRHTPILTTVCTLLPGPT